MTELELMFRAWEQPGSLYAPEAEDDAAELDGVVPLPGLSVAELVR